MTGSDSTVVVLTGADDPTADAVVDELRRRDADIHRFDLADFPTRAQLAATYDGRRWQGTITVDDGTTVDVESVTSIYYRRPSRFAFDPQMSVVDRAFAEEEARIGLGGVLSSMECRWVSHPHRAARAEWKPLQLHVASTVGLVVPRTLISNSITHGREFIRSASGPVVCKALSSTTFTEDGAHKVIYTTVVDEDSLDSRAFEATAHLLQEWIPKAYDARVTVVGEQVLATAITTDAGRARIDWRSNYSALRYDPVEVPVEVVAGLYAYLAVFDLPFGAFDFTVTPEGEWIMLECNPNGQWLWLYHRANLPVPSALADLLTADRPVTTSAGTL